MYQRASALLVPLSASGLSYFLIFMDFNEIKTEEKE